jgi:hypothetical protein
MDTFFNILRKGIVFSMMLIFAFVFTYVPQYFVKEVPTVEAFGDVDPDSPLLGAILAASGINTTANVTQATKDGILDAIGWAIAKTIISSLINSMINWINSGFKGSPAFVQDLKRNLIDLADRTAGEFIKRLGGIGSFICSPFQLDIQLALSLEYQRAREEKPIETCTLSGIVGNIEDFLEGNFSQGGWEDWIEITSKPEAYTPYGQLLTARSAMRVKLANAEGQTLAEIDWGGGFLSGKICEMIEGSSGPEESCVISKPGQTIANSLNKALGASTDQLVAADEINELIAALIGQLANQAITGAAGLLGLSAGTGYTYGGFDGGSYTAAAQAQAAQTGSEGAAASGITAQTFSDAIAVQNNAVRSANSNITRLLAVANNRSTPADKAAAARLTAQSAANTRTKALDDTPKISTLLAEFRALDTEAANPNTTDARKLQITQRKAQLYTEFTRLQVITAPQLKALEETWAAALI